MPQTNRPDSFELGSSQDVMFEIRVLEKRLRDGEEVLRQGREAGQDATILDRWESAWIGLLGQYERLCDRVAGQLGSAEDEPNRPMNG